MQRDISDRAVEVRDEEGEEEEEEEEDVGVKWNIICFAQFYYMSRYIYISKRDFFVATPFLLYINLYKIVLILNDSEQ